MTRNYYCTTKLHEEKSITMVSNSSVQAHGLMSFASGVHVTSSMLATPESGNNPSEKPHIEYMDWEKNNTHWGFFLKWKNPEIR